LQAAGNLRRHRKTFLIMESMLEIKLLKETEIADRIFNAGTVLATAKIKDGSVFVVVDMFGNGEWLKLNVDCEFVDEKTKH
jgi:hypothetical protein